jgi:hypothetical protein
MRLNDQIIRKLPSPPQGYTLTWDSETRGFGLRVTAKGAKSFVLQYRANGVSRRHTIGSFPDWPTTAAREEAKRLKRIVDTGGDPALDRRENQVAPTVKLPKDLASGPLSVREILQIPAPAKIGIYFLFSGSNLQYVGQSSNVFLRVASHERAKAIPFDHWTFIPASLEKDLDYIEADYIRTHQPPFNRGLRNRRPKNTAVAAGPDAAIL